MVGEHTLYISSSACTNIYSGNTTDKFTNRLNSPISLNSNIEYEIGLTSMLYPTSYYAVRSETTEFSINVSVTIKGRKGKLKYHNHNYICNKSIIAGDIKHIVKMINSDLINEVKTYLDPYYTKYVMNDKILYWGDNEKRCVLNHIKRTGKAPLVGDATILSLKFSKKICDLFGFVGKTYYEIYRSSDIEKTVARYPASPRCNINYLYIYCDKIQPSPFGGQLVNILDCLTFENGYNKGIHNTVYKKLNTSYIDEISIIVTDQNGKRIYFYEDSSITCVLHIRPQ